MAVAERQGRERPEKWNKARSEDRREALRESEQRPGAHSQARGREETHRRLVGSGRGQWVVTGGAPGPPVLPLLTPILGQFFLPLYPHLNSDLPSW